MSLESKLSNEEIAREVEGQIQETGLLTDLENRAIAVGGAAARALVKKAGLDWPEP